jgi:autotransporter-associated beta strand protein
VTPTFTRVRLAALIALASWIPIAANATASSFTWQDVNGTSYVTAIRDQGQTGTCVAFATAALLENKYMLTRDVSSTATQFSVQQFVCDGIVGLYSGGYLVTEDGYTGSLDYLESTGLVNESTLQWTGKRTSPQWSGSTAGSATCVVNSYSSISTSSGTVKNALTTYGAVIVTVNADDYIVGSNYYIQGQLSSSTTTFSTLGTSSSDELDHAVLIVGYVDTSSAAGGGYYIIKNSWGTNATYFPSGYFYVTYGSFEAKGEAYVVDGSAYYATSLATATWSGSSGVWSAGSTGWTSKSSTYTWVNEETAATFSGTANTAVTVSGKVIAYGMTFASSAAAFTFSGGSITVDHGGITANQDVTINSVVSVGAPATWTVAANKSLAVNGALHTIINDLTLANSGTITLAGGIDGGGVLNSTGAAPGSMTMTGTGTTHITGSSNVVTNFNMVAGSTVFSGNTLAVGGSQIVGSASSSLAAFSQTAGSVSFASSLYVGYISGGTGSYNLGGSASSLTAPSSEYVGYNGTGIFTQTGGANSVAGTLYLGYNSGSRGTYNLNGGALAVGSLKKNSGTATFNFGGGTLSFISAGTCSLPMNLTAAVTDATVNCNGYAITLSGSLSGAGGLVKVGGGALTLSAANTYTGTTLIQSGSLVFKGSTAIAAATISTAKTDVGAGTLVFDYSSAGASVAATIESLLTASHANSFASGVIYSTLAASNNYALGWSEDTASKTVTVRVALYGDATLDGTVNVYDLGQVLANYNTTGAWAAGDFNYDGTVNIYDLGQVLANYDKSLTLSGTEINTSDYAGLDGAAVAALQAAGVNVVPEPGSLALLTAGALGLLIYRRRRRR